MREKLQKVQIKRLVILNLPYFFIFYVADKGSWLYRHCLGESMVQRLGVMLVNFRLAFLSWLPSIALQDLTVGVLVAGALKLVVYYRSKNAKKFRQGVEYGSARWGNRKDIEPFMNPVFENNVILTETERLTMNSRPKAPKYARNKNVIVIGGSGSGKTRFYVKPNLMQMTDHVSYVVTDPKGTIIVECGKMLVNGGYRIKVLNTINFKKSMHYNPFHYIRSEKDILKLVNTIIANTKGEGEKSTEDFWVKAERLLYSALIGYIWYEAPEEEQNFSTLLEFINASETKFSDNSYGFRPNRSAEHAIAQCMRLIQVQHMYHVVDLDIKGFFDNINHTKLIRQIWALGIRDKKLLCIIKEMLKAPVILPNGDNRAVKTLITKIAEEWVMINSRGFEENATFQRIQLFCFFYFRNSGCKGINTVM